MRSNPAIVLFSLLLLFTGCSTTPENTKTDESENLDSIPDMSIFQLPSDWETQHGDHIQLSSLKGNVLVVVMIYTSCQSACPRLVADMKNIQEKVGDDHETPIKYVLVSIDPETDTPERLASFAEEREMTDDCWLFLRGSEENTREFANVLAVKYAEISPIDFSHSNIISVFDKYGVMQHQQEGLGLDNQETVAKIISLAQKH